MNRLHRGVIAGVAGTLALEIATYVDMTVRGRPSSEMPAKAAEELAKMANVDFGEGDAAKNKASGAGALLGYATGISVGILAGAFGGRRHLHLKTGVLVGGLAMAAADIPMVALKLTNPQEWKREDWLADIVPHLVYGLVTVQILNSTRKFQHWHSPLSNIHLHHEAQ